jgi:mutator protein MutT
MVEIIAVVAAIIRRDEKILITQRFDKAHLGGMWEFPGGKVEAGETLEIALKREILEELGLIIQVGGEFHRTDHNYPAKSIRLHFFDCTILEGEPQLLDVADMRWVAPKQLSDFQFPPADAELIAKLRFGI